MNNFSKMPDFDESIGKQWHEDFQGLMHKARENGCGVDDEFGAQQEIYTKVCLFLSWFYEYDCVSS